MGATNTVGDNSSGSVYYQVPRRGVRSHGGISPRAPASRRPVAPSRAAQANRVRTSARGIGATPLTMRSNPLTSFANFGRNLDGSPAHTFTTPAGGGYQSGSASGGGSALGGGAPYDPYAALYAALDARAAQAHTQIGQGATQYLARLAALNDSQVANNTQTLANISAGSTQRQANYQSQVNPVTADLTAQGFSAAPVKQAATIDLQNLLGEEERQKQLSQRFAEINARSYGDHQATSAEQTAGANNTVNMRLAEFKMKLAMQAAADAAGGSGGGGGYGGGGGSGYDGPPSISVSNAMSDAAGNANSELVKYAGSLFGGNPLGQRIWANQVLKQLAPDGSNVGAVLRSFNTVAAAKRSKGKNLGFRPSTFGTLVGGPLRAAAGQQILKNAPRQKKGGSVVRSQTGA